MSQKEGSEFAELIITNYDPRLFLASSSPLEDMFNAYDNFETINMEPIRESIEDRAHPSLSGRRRISAGSSCVNNHRTGFSA